MKKNYIPKRNLRIFFLFVFHFSFFVFHSSFTSAQSWLWGREASQANGQYSEAEVWEDHTIAVDGLGNAYVTGMFFDTLAFGTDTLRDYSYYGTDVFLVKYDANGNMLWARQANNEPNSSSDVEGYSVAVDGSGNSYVTGYFTDTISFGHDTLKSGSVFLAKYDANGNVLWVKNDSNGANSVGFGDGACVAVDGSGHVYVAGFFEDTIYFGSHRLISSGNDIFLTKYDASGNLLWARQSTKGGYAAPLFGGIPSIAVDRIGNIYLTGGFIDTLAFGTDTIREISLSNSDVFLAKFNSNGSPLWAKRATQTSSTCYGMGNSVAVDGAGHPYVTGYFSDTLIFGADTVSEKNSQYGHAYNDVFLTQYDTAGNTIWAKQGTILDGNPWVGYSVVCDTLKQGGGYLAIGNWGFALPVWYAPFELKFGADTFSLNNTYGSATIYLHFDSAGNVLCGNVFSEGSEDDGDGVGVDPSGQYKYLAGDLSGVSVFGTDTTSQTVVGEMPFVSRWNACCSVPITVRPLDTIVCPGSPVTLTATGATTYNWSPPTGLSATTGSSVIARAISNTRYQIIGASSGCGGVTSVVVDVLPTPAVSITATKDSICSGDSTHLSASGGTTYLWVPGNSTANNIWVKPTAKFTYSLAVSNGICSTDTSFTVAITPFPAITLTPDSTICKGETITLIASGGGTYKWSNNATSSSIAVTPSQAATYSVTVNKGCVGSASTNISIDVPMVTVCCNDTIKSGSVINLNASGGSMYSWAPDTGLSCTSCPTPIANPTVTTSYTITSKDGVGCQVTGIITITVEAGCANFTMPNVFTPNYAGASGVDKVLYIKTDNIDTWLLTIYDRWGKEVFKSTSATQYWTGLTESGVQAPDGVYYYLVSATCQGNTYKKDGFIQLIR